MSVKEVLIGDVCEVGDGAHSKVKRIESGVTYLTSKNMGQGTLKLHKIDYISEEDFEKLFPAKSKAIRRPQAGDLLIGIIGTFGNSYLYKDSDHFGFASSIGIIRPNPKYLYPKYLYYVISSKKFKAIHSNHNAGSVQGYTNIPTIKSLPIPLQALPTQKRIAHILGTLDDKIELNRQMNKTLEAMAQAIFKSWFVDFDPVHAKANAIDNGQDPEAAAMKAICGQNPDLLGDAEKLKHIASLFPSEFEESELGLIPKGWEVSTIGESCEFKNGYAFKSKELNKEGEGLPVFKMGHIKRGGGFNSEGTKSYYDEEIDKKLNNYLLKKGDVLMAMTDMKNNMAILGHTALMPETDKFVVNQRVGRITSKNTQTLNYPFIYLMTNSPAVIEDLRSRSNSGVQVNLSTSGIKETQFVLPSKKIHTRFDEITVATLDQMIFNDFQNTKLSKLRDTLLPKLLSGELSVDNAKSEMELV
jgi:type I restriction enzyme S subunit